MDLTNQTIKELLYNRVRELTAKSSLDPNITNYWVVIK